MKILVVCLNPTFQRTMIFDDFQLGEVNRCKELYFDASGKGVNVSRILSQKGISSKVLTQLNCSQAQSMIELCKKDDVNLLYALCDAKIRTCTTVLSNNKTTELVEEAYPVSSFCSRDIIDLFDSNIDNFDALIITGTRAKGFEESIYSDFVRKAKQKKKLVVLDLSKDELLKCIKSGPDVIKPNLQEFMLTFMNLKINENEDSNKYKDLVKDKMKELYDEFGINIILTRSSFPIWSYSKLGFLEIPIKPIEKIVNTIGCGDTFTAILTMELLNKQSFSDSIYKASEAAALNAQVIRPASLI